MKVTQIKLTKYPDQNTKYCKHIINHKLHKTVFSDPHLKTFGWSKTWYIKCHHWVSSKFIKKTHFLVSFLSIICESSLKIAYYWCSRWIRPLVFSFTFSLCQIKFTKIIIFLAFPAPFPQLRFLIAQIFLEVRGLAAAWLNSSYIK